MPSDVRIAIERESDIVTARQHGRELAASIGFSTTDQTLLATAISEVARNIVTYAARGEIELAIVEVSGRKGVKVIASDEGPGIPNIELAMRDGWSTMKSLGVGLPGTKRVMDEFELATEVGVGTTITMIKWSR